MNNSYRAARISAVNLKSNLFATRERDSFYVRAGERSLKASRKQNKERDPVSMPKETRIVSVLLSCFILSVWSGEKNSSRNPKIARGQHTRARAMLCNLENILTVLACAGRLLCCSPLENFAEFPLMAIDRG
jgi:hypothetical protein